MHRNCVDLKVRIALAPLVAFWVFALLPAQAPAQNFGSAGQSWSTSWYFASPTDRSLALQQAQIIRQAENGPDITSTSTYNTYYDNRYNYVETSSSDGDANADLHVGDEIGENTYSVGSLNTGSTTITVDGNGNTVSAVNSAETTGCVDGSINSATLPEGYPYPPVNSACR